MMCASEDLAEERRGTPKYSGLFFFFFKILFACFILFLVLIWPNPRHFNSSVILYTCLLAVLLLHETFIWKGLF